MAICKECGNRVLIGIDFVDGVCYQCQNAAFQHRKLVEQQPEIDEIKAVLLTTEVAPNLNITKRIEIVSAECAFGMNIFKDIAIAFSNVVGGRSETVQKVMRESRKTVLYELKREAFLVGANAVVGVDLDYVEMGSAGSNMVMLVASGTAVIVEDV